MTTALDRVAELAQGIAAHRAGDGALQAALVCLLWLALALAAGAAALTPHGRCFMMKAPRSHRRPRADRGHAAGARRRPARFEARRLALEGDAIAVVPADLDGDGRLDLLAAYRTGLPPYQKRFLAVFWNQGRSFSARPDEVIALDERTSCAFDVADVDGEPGAEVLMVTPSGVQARSLRGRKVGPADRPDESGHHLLSADAGRPAAPAAGPGGRRRRRPRPAGPHGGRAGGSPPRRTASTPAPRAWRWPWTPAAAATGAARARPSGALGTIQVTYAFPVLTVADTDGDGRKDIVAALEDRLAVYRQSAPYVFAPQPTFRRDFAVRTGAELTQMSSGAATTVTDIDLDGLADVMVRKQVARGITSAATTSFVYFGRRGGAYPPRPDQVIRSEGVGGTEVELFDVTGDGRSDLVVPSVNIGVMAIIRVLTTKSVKVNFQVFPFDAKARRFAPQPAAERQLKFRLSLSGETGVQAADLRGDYNGDRRPDLAFGTDDEELSVFPGTCAAGLFDEDAAEQIAGPRLRHPRGGGPRPHRQERHGPPLPRHQGPPHRPRRPHQPRSLVARLFAVDSSPICSPSPVCGRGWG